MKHKIIGLVVGCALISFSIPIYENISSNGIDNKYKIINNIVYQMEDYHRFKLNESYYEIVEEVKRKKLIQEQEERIAKWKAEKLEEEKKRKAELEKKRLAKLREKKKQEQVVVSRGDTSGHASDWMTFEASYYTAFCDTGCTGVTATGYDVSNTIYYNGYRILASDNSVLPLYSLVEVVTPYETFKAVVLDRGGAIQNKKLDVLVSSRDEAYRLGRHNVKLRVIKYGK